MIEVGGKYGCLTVLDNGEEYDSSEWVKERRNSGSEIKKHYKCQCKCGKIFYYNEKTLKFKPRYCRYPISIADNRFIYSIPARNATHKKEKKYEDIECVILWSKPPSRAPVYLSLLEEHVDGSLPSDEYCERYNNYKLRQLKKKEEEYKEIEANFPRNFAKNYDFDYTGKQYESLLIEECVNEHFESKPHLIYLQPIRGQKRKVWSSITVYKQYRCRCSLCGNEMLITCDQFGIFPPTEYGYHAYNGYWSEVYCDKKCHPISSFQWIVTKILFENDVKYQVEYSFSDLYGIYGKNKLRYDFAILENDGSIKHLIECQGEQHFKPIEEFGGQKQFEIQIKNDLIKRDYAKAHNIPLLEISYKDKNIEKINEIFKEIGII